MDVTVAVDANGADLGPAEVAAGAALAAAAGVRVVLFGPADEMGDPPAGVDVVDAPVSIAKAADPAGAVRAQPDASIVRAARAVAEGDADALVSGGSTGPALAAGLFNIRRAAGIYRPALAISVPVPGHPVTIVDVGANTEVRAEHLVQFGFMGAALTETVLGIERPRVGLLSNGGEATKGTPLIVQAHAALSKRMAEGGRYDFIGNVEGNEVTAGKADVIVTDGFTGNVALKLMEGVSETMLRAIRDVATSSRRAKTGGLLLRPALLEFRDALDPESAGGAYLLGLRRLGVVPHGRFSRRGIAQAILLAARGTREDVVGRTHAALEEAGALRRGPLGTAPSEPASSVPSS
ncbi:MAG: plsX [Solirubrobacterales bacterium]|jgi:glycerol-3-phosphate acyltransferase PlsX|nr:plsX [Solirubrobacterales bacterium]